MRINSDSREVYHGDAPKSDRKELPATAGKLVAETGLRIVFSGKRCQCQLAASRRPWVFGQRAKSLCLPTLAAMAMMAIANPARSNGAPICAKRNAA